MKKIAVHALFVVAVVAIGSSIGSATLGLVVILPMLISTVFFAKDRWEIDRASTWLFVPYGLWDCLWTGFATLLNLSIVLLN